MVSEKIIVKNELGIHLRPASLISKSAIEYHSKISLKAGYATVNAKSVLGILGACVKQNDEIEIICEGKDEKEALRAIIKLIEDGMGDEL